MSANLPSIAQGYRHALADLGRRRTGTLRTREAIDREIAAEVDRALGAGVSFTACAELVGLSRQGLYNLLDRYETPNQ